MPRVSLNQPAPDFSLLDFSGKPVRLADFCGQKCTAGFQPDLYLTILPKAYGTVTGLSTICRPKCANRGRWPRRCQSLARLLAKGVPAFIGLPKPSRQMYETLYRKRSWWLQAGTESAQVLIDKSGMARFVHYGHNVSDIPKTRKSWIWQMA